MSNGIPNWPTAGAPTSGNPPTANLVDLCAYYVSRLVLQYADKPKAQAMTALFAKQAMADDMATQLLNAFTLGTAVGAQLDILGKYIGVPRNINPATYPPAFSFRDYNSGNPQGTNGWVLYDGSSPANGNFFTYGEAAQPTTNLTDSQYSFVLLLKIGLNSQDGTLFAIQNFIATFISEYVSVTDNQDMTLSYTISTSAPISTTLLQQFLPKPMGVGINVSETFTRITSSGDTRVTSSGDTRVTI